VHVTKAMMSGHRVAAGSHKHHTISMLLKACHEA
jgi:hypothetical protein